MWLGVIRFARLVPAKLNTLVIDHIVSFAETSAHPVGHTVFGTTAAAPSGSPDIVIPIVKPAVTSACSWTYQMQANMIASVSCVHDQLQLVCQC